MQPELRTLPYSNLKKFIESLLMRSDLTDIAIAEEIAKSGIKISEQELVMTLNEMTNAGTISPHAKIVEIIPGNDRQINTYHLNLKPASDGFFNSDLWSGFQLSKFTL